MGFTTLALVGLAALQGTLAHGDAPAAGVSGECKPTGMAIIDTLLCSASTICYGMPTIRSGTIRGEKLVSKSPHLRILLLIFG
jgi:hypothetical protein